MILRTIGTILSGVIVLGIGVTLVFGIGRIQSIYNKTIGVEIQNSETDKYHYSKSYIDGMVKDLANHKEEYETANNEMAKTAILKYIQDKFSNFDERTIINRNLRDFLNDVRNGAIK